MPGATSRTAAIAGQDKASAIRLHFPVLWRMSVVLLEMDVSCKLQPGRPGFRNLSESEGEGLMVGESDEVSALQEIPKVPYRQVQGEKLPVKRTTLSLRRVMLTAEKGERPPGTVERLLQYAADRVVRGIYG